eukprot:CAMPEP_0170636558 /NCGR_PEP_ID=MMETSP0224-20130122/37883_1 /TAXON_ID=285029 /ORGANISM="Togula jolla, Strain CCCM 725" /LENGTH=192 /DNA_ID=CAMNT_0010966261 /DNA_START=209 /DNA_END=784 /DNA_ORIENTATION=-
MSVLCTGRLRIWQPVQLPARPCPPCKFFAKGCAKGASCRFKHQLATNPPTSGNSAETLPGASAGFAGRLASPCVFHMRGQCLRGLDCHFRHLESPEQEESESGPEGKEVETSEGKAEGKEGKEGKPERSASDILRKYSASTRAQAEGLEVRFKRRTEGTGLRPSDLGSMPESQLDGKAEMRAPDAAEAEVLE